MFWQMKRALKALVRGIALVFAAPAAVTELLCRYLLGHDVWFSTHAQFFSLVPGKIGSYFRVAYYRMTLRHCADDCYIGFGTLITHSEAQLGSRVYIGTRCIIGTATVNADVMLADHVQVLSGKYQHGTDLSNGAFQRQPQKFTHINIGSNCWIGANAVIMANIGEQAIVGAGSVVTRAVEPCTVVAGVPARVIRTAATQDLVLSRRKT